MKFLAIFKGFLAHNCHFNKCPRQTPAKFDGLTISVLSFIEAPPDTKAGQAERDKEEKRWIHHLSSKHRPTGSRSFRLSFTLDTTNLVHKTVLFISMSFNSSLLLVGF